MSTEQSEPVSHYGDDGHVSGSAVVAVGDGTGGTAGNANGTGTGGGGRRRRRRRKNKGGANANAGNNGAAVVAGTGDEGGSALASQTAPVTAPAPSGQQNGSQGGPQNQNGGHNNGSKRHKQHGKKRNGGGGGSNGNNRQPGMQGNGGGWKRRTGEGPDGNREGAPGGYGSGSEAGYDNNGNGGARRKGKFARRSFVGPMDHSYRVANGNVADTSHSTMDYRNVNGNVLGRGEAREIEAVPQVREDAPTRILCFIEDLFVVAKMQESARKLGVKVQFVKAEKEQLAAITDAPENERPALIIFDLNNANAKPLTVIPKLKAKLKRGTSIIGFLGQIQGDLKLKATEAGCDTVMPRSAFSQSVPNLLRRYGFAEEEEMMEA